MAPRPTTIVSNLLTIYSVCRRASKPLASALVRKDVRPFPLPLLFRSIAEARRSNRQSLNRCATFNPDSAVGREVMSEEQTFRNEDNAFLPLRSRQLSVRCVTKLSTGGGEPSVKIDFETERSGVFAAPGLLLAHFSLRNSGSRHYGPAVRLLPWLMGIGPAQLRKSISMPERKRQQGEPSSLRR